MKNKKRPSLKDFHKKLKIKMVEKNSKSKFIGSLGAINFGGA